MTVLVTRNASGRVRGYLASCMCEIAPGIYTAPRMSAAVRRRIWRVMEDWHRPGQEESVVMTWRSPREPGGQSILTLGVPRTTVLERDGMFLTRRTVTADDS